MHTITSGTVSTMVGPVEFTQHRDGTVSMRTSVENMERVHRAIMIAKGAYTKNTISYSVFKTLGRRIRNAAIDKNIW